MKTLMTIMIAACAVSVFAQCSEGKSGCEKSLSAEEQFMAEANRMAIEAEGKKACCKTTAVKKVVKGDAGCCNAKGEPAKFKVFVAGHGYKFFGCEGSATKERAELVAKKVKVGPIQKAGAGAKL